VLAVVPLLALVAWIGARGLLDRRALASEFARIKSGME
jgi:hypothetical protein